MKTAHRERGVAIAAILMAALFSVLVAPSAQAAPPTPSRATVASGGIPALVNPTADLAAQVPGPEVTWVDSIFIAGRVHAAGHNFGILVHTLDSPNADQRKLYVSIADTTTGWYRNYAAMIPKDHYMWSRKRLHITMPGLSWTGSERQMHVKATTPWGSLNARFGPKGPVLNYQSNELIELLGDVNYEYAFPAMRTVSALTAESRKRRVSGAS